MFFYFFVFPLLLCGILYLSGKPGCVYLYNPELGSGFRVGPSSGKGTPKFWARKSMANMMQRSLRLCPSAGRISLCTWMPNCCKVATARPRFSGGTMSSASPCVKSTGGWLLSSSASSSGPGEATPLRVGPRHCGQSAEAVNTAARNIIAARFMCI